MKALGKELYDAFPKGREFETTWTSLALTKERKQHSLHMPIQSGLMLNGTIWLALKIEQNKEDRRTCSYDPFPKLTFLEDLEVIIP